MSTDDPDATSLDASEETPQASPRRRRLWTALAVAATVGFIAYVVVSARDAAVPVGASGSMPGMSMPMGGGDGVRFTARDVEGRIVRFPGGSPRARYVVDDRNGSVQSMLDSPGLASSLVYDARGRAVSRPDPASPRIAKALRRAGA